MDHVIARASLHRRAAACLALATLGATAAFPSTARSVRPTDSAPTTVAARAGIDPASLAVPFVDEGGRHGVRYSARALAATVAVTDDGRLVYALPGVGAIASKGEPRTAGHRHSSGPGWNLVERFVDGRLAPVGIDPAQTRVSRFVGNDSPRHRVAQSTFAQVALGEVFPGVSVRLRATGTNVEKIFTVAPGADPARIRMALDGALALGTSAEGALVAATGNGDVAFTPPVAFQIVDGQRRPVTVAYVADAKARRYGFAVGDYDPSRELVIDPLLQATYVGGDSADYINAVTVNPTTGDIIVAGATLSTNLPCTTVADGCSAGYQPALNGSGYDGLVGRLSADLQQFLQLTYLGGTGSDEIAAVAVHPVTGEVLVAGVTDSSDLPCTTHGGVCANAAQPTYWANTDGFAARLSADLTQLLQATYYGGSEYENLTGMIVHPLSGDIVLFGHTQSPFLWCTSVASGCLDGAQPAHKPDGVGGWDGFVVRVSSDLLQFKQGTFIGGGNYDFLYAAAVDPKTGDIYVGGNTASTDLACTTLAGTCANAAQSAHAADAGAADGFITRFAGDLLKLKQTTYLGGNSHDGVRALAFHPLTGELYAAGSVGSTNFPCTTQLGICGNGAQTAFAGVGQYDAFVARLLPDLTQLRQATYLGGSGNDFAMSLAIHPVTGDVYVGGSTASSNLPCTTAGNGCANGAQSTKVGNTTISDAFVMRMPADLTTFRQATYYGGAQSEQYGGMVLHPLTEEVIVAGSTPSTDLLCTTAGNGCGDGAQTTHAVDPGYLDGFVVRISPDLSTADTTPNPFAFTPKSGVPPLSVQTSAPVKVTGLSAATTISIAGPPGAAYCVASSADCGACDVSGDFVSSPGALFNNNWVCARQRAPAAANSENYSAIQIGPRGARFYVSTGSAIGTGCSLDADGNGDIDALTDGLIILRALLGMTGSAVTTDATGPNPTRGTWDLIRPFLNGNCGTTFAP
jgi:hypothetical protein